MIKINPASINDLVELSAAGVPVTLTSHPGNASLYKLALWQCGIPEHLWDVTCCVADANNWPMFRLQNGKAELLLTEELHAHIIATTNSNRRFVTAYQKTRDGDRLGRLHVRACERSFPRRISSCSRLLLSETSKAHEVFSYLAETCSEKVFTRFITPDGVMIPIREAGISKANVVDSFMRVLHELDYLLFSDEPIETKGGACYDGVMVPLATMLSQYWKTGRIDRYDISGPDMIHYASRKEHQESLAYMLQHLRKWDRQIIPENFVVRMYPGTVARVGHIKGHDSQGVMVRKISALESQHELTSQEKRLRWEDAKEDERIWPISIQPSRERYFSQHDLLAYDQGLSVAEYWKNIPLEGLAETLRRANALLRIK